MDCEWDENKRLVNLHKHGIDFSVASDVFLDPNRIETIDIRKDYGEERIQTIGYGRPGLLFVIYTYRDQKSKRRIISARRASKREKAIYNSQIGQ